MIKTGEQQRCSVGTTIFLWSAMIVAITANGAAADVLFNQPANSNWTRIESPITTSPLQDLEAADDFDGDCTVGAADLAILLGNWG